ncbi:LysE family translocator [Nocardioides marmorisolisilvae]|uniref:LysE family translocator n=1 Tax=Nocardioides marmorisolisilvae TaxID=1542737 RepID=A0A3N0DV20_9ACTN|nr:LysE family translocator [Nocardioides marmorisolisilvae]RNL79472.1 LysE family translocator [Nocardioides marmorisolisilvae]
MLLEVLAFTGAAALIVLLPGPDTLVVVRSILRGGRRQGILTALGNLTGLTIWVTAAVVGIAALLKASEVGYATLRIVGAAYLIFLGIQAFRTRGQVSDVPEARAILGTGFGAGILTNLLNPKVGVFFVTFLPGFVPSGASVPAITALYGGIFIVLTGLYWVVLLGLAGKVTAWMNTPKIRRRLDVATAGVLVLFGARLATE